MTAQAGVKHSHMGAMSANRIGYGASASPETQLRAVSAPGNGILDEIHAGTFPPRNGLALPALGREARPDRPHKTATLSGSNRKRRWKERRPAIYQSSDGSSSTSARSGLPPSISRSSFAHSEGRSSISLGIFPSFTSSLNCLSIGPITSVSHLCTLRTRPRPVRWAVWAASGAEGTWQPSPRRRH